MLLCYPKQYLCEAVFETINPSGEELAWSVCGVSMHGQAAQEDHLCRCSGSPDKPHKLLLTIHWQSIILGSRVLYRKVRVWVWITSSRGEDRESLSTFWITQPYKQLCSTEDVQPLFTALKEKWSDPYILHGKRCITVTRWARILILPTILVNSLFLPWQLHTEKLAILDHHCEDRMLFQVLPKYPG